MINSLFEYLENLYKEISTDKRKRNTALVLVWKQ